MTKQEIRQEILATLKAMSPEERARQSTIIIQKLKALPKFQNAQKVLLYVSLPYEVHTHALIRECLETKEVYLPKVNLAQGMIELYRLEKWSDLTRGPFGALEPVSTAKIDAGELDLAVIPGVAFTLAGKRLGHGLGYYDKLLAQAPQLYTIGLAYAQQMKEDLPLEEHDINLHLVLSPH